MSAESIRTEITNSMIDAISNGTIPWRKPWDLGSNFGIPCNFGSRRRYTGINPIILMMRSYVSKNWGSSSAWLEKVGVHVKKGEKATSITFFNMIVKKDPQTKKPVLTAAGNQVKIPIMKEYPVFNADQMQPPAIETILDGRCASGRSSIVKALLGIEGNAARVSQTTQEELVKIAHKYIGKKGEFENLSKEDLAKVIVEGIQKNLDTYTSSFKESGELDYAPAEHLISSCGIEFKTGSKACYNLTSQIITLPPKNSFESVAAFYETAFHEMIHWTQDKSRVGIKEQVSEMQYAFNELVAEIGACLLMAELKVPMAEKLLANSQSYVAGWLKAMKGDSKFIFDAATMASKSVEFLFDFIGHSNVEFKEEAA